jgi:YVTN family beta-propeller protein
MNDRSFIMTRYKTRGWLEVALLVVFLITPGVSGARENDIGHPTFLSPHASPILKSGGHVFVVNTPADTVDVIDASSRAVIKRINVGVDPVGIAARPDGMEIWVSNHVSDSISVIDSDPRSPAYLHVIATVQNFDPLTGATRFDEPMGVAFASNEKAYAALSSENQVAVVDVATRQVVKELTITAQDPRAIAVHGDRLYVIPFESNNQSQISGCVDRIDNDLCTFDATEHVIDNNNVLSLFAVVDIVRNPRVPDRDMYIFDTTTDQLVEIVDTLGTLLYGLAVDSTGRVFIAQTDARNDINGRAGTFNDGLAEMENRAFLNQLTRVDCSGDSCARPQYIELEPVPPANPSPGMALATPFAIEISVDDATLVVSAAGSNKLFTVDAASGEVLGRVEVDAAPRGIALESDAAGRPSKAWVLNAVANTVSLVDVSDPANPRLTDTITLDDPTHPVVKRGRIAFNDADASTTGTFSCESCHPDGGTDQLAWVLDTPICDVPGCTQIPPRITMPIRGLRDTAPYHWDGIPGDPYGGRNTANINGSDEPNCSQESPESCTRFLLDGSLATTMCEAATCPLNEEGKDGALTKAERDDMAKFLLSVPYPPAQRRSYTNVLSDTAASGFRLFHIYGDLQGDPQPNVCGNCHRMPFWVSTNSVGTGMEAPTWRGAYDRWLILPQGRLNLIDFDFYRNITAKGVPERNMWRFSWGSRTRFDPVWNMVLEGSTGFSGSFARQISFNQATAGSALTADLLDALELSAREGGVALHGEGVFIDGETATPIALRFDHRVKGGSYVDRAGGLRAFSRSELLALASGGSFLGTFTARIGANVDVDNPQPGIWTRGPNHIQRGKQIFPTLSGDDTTMVISGRHIREGANLFVDGRRAPGTVVCKDGELPECDFEVIEVQLPSLPTPAGMHFLQIQNPDGLFSNDFIIHSDDRGQDNCPEIPNPEQNDTDGDGVGDRCDDDAFEFEIEPGISGAWFDPARNGEGWFVEVLDENSALVYWFTYTPPAVGTDQAQAWIGGLGEIKGSSIVVPAAEAFISIGPPFGTDFDPERVDLRPWGKFVLSFSSCNGGLMYYQSDDPDYGHGSLDLTRLTTIETLECGSPAPPAPQPAADGEFTVTPAISGVWYDPSHNGEGWLLEILADGQALIAWFSYDTEGEQAWFYNAGTVMGNQIIFDLLMPSGTDFGPTFDGEDLSHPVWGTATFTFDSCNSGSMTYDSPLEGYGSGNLQLKRVTYLSGLECE